MDANRFDALTRSYTIPSSRRGALRVLAGAFGAWAGFTTAIVSFTVMAKRKKPTPNQFGCLNVGQKCNGKSSKCCSGICQGKKAKNGKKDKSTCIAHNEGSCTPGLSICTSQNPSDAACNPSNMAAFCLVTTGNAGFCAQLGGPNNCQPCSRDTDCEALGLPAGSACVFVSGEPLCGDSCPATQGRACRAPGI
jgi:hypothetical protein